MNGSAGALAQIKSTYPVTDVAELMKLQEITNMDKGISIAVTE